MIFSRQIIVSEHTAYTSAAKSYHDHKTFKKIGNVSITNTEARSSNHCCSGKVMCHI
jgi:hypothetical protein